MIGDLIAAYSTYCAVGMVASFAVVGAWNTFKRLTEW